MGKEKSETFEIISLDESDDRAKMQHFNSNGETGIMIGSLVKNDFNIQGKDLKFKGEINSENTLITGKWYIRKENKNWEEFIDLKLQKEKEI
ncbi:hypothetical protein D9M71_734420 [compost metagenome]